MRSAATNCLSTSMALHWHLAGTWPTSLPYTSSTRTICVWRQVPKYLHNRRYVPSACLSRSLFSGSPLFHFHFSSLSGCHGARGGGGGGGVAKHNVEWSLCTCTCGSPQVGGAGGAFINRRLSCTAVPLYHPAACESPCFGTSAKRLTQDQGLREGLATLAKRQRQSRCMGAWMAWMAWMHWQRERHFYIWGKPIFSSMSNGSQVTAAVPTYIFIQGLSLSTERGNLGSTLWHLLSSPTYKHHHLLLVVWTFYLY